MPLRGLSGRCRPAPDLHTPPVPLAKGMPAYPDDARKQGIEAVVVVKFVVGDNGQVEDVKIVKGHPLYVTDLQARERRVAIPSLFISAFAGVALGFHLRADREGRLWKKKSGYSS